MKHNQMSHNTFYKYSGAGNTFLISKEKLSLSLNEKKELVTNACDPVDGFSADGVLFLEKKDNLIHWEFYNSDGSVAEMCGNAARCAFKFSYDHMLEGHNKPTQIQFKTLSGIIKGQRSGDKICIEMTAAKKELGKMPQAQFIKEFILNVKNNFPADLDLISKQLISEIENEDFLSIDTGVPHFVMEIKNFSAYENLKKLCSALRHYKIFPRGTNVTLIKINSINEAQAVTFERGVEGFTLACGTGAVAAGIYLGMKNKKNKLNITMPGGLLNIELDEVFNSGEFNFQKEIKSPLLIGDAKYIGKIIV